MTERTTKAQVIFDAMMGDIAGGRFPPGEALDELRMARAYGVSRTPVREAIRRLELTGLVETRSHKGAVVAGFTEKQLDDLFAVMAELEALCAKWSALAMTDKERQALRIVHREAGPLIEVNDRPAYIAANAAFHQAIYEGAHNEFLADLVASARRRAAPFRRAQFDAPHRLASSHREHASIVSAIMAGDAEGAYRAMRSHLVVVRSAVDHVDVLIGPDTQAQSDR